MFKFNAFIMYHDHLVKGICFANISHFVCPLEHFCRLVGVGY